MTNQNIMLIEDDQDSAEILLKILRAEGYHVIHFSDGNTLVDHSATTPQLYIVDYNIPSIDGLALCKFLKLQNRSRNIPVIIVSGNHEIKERVIRAGAYAFIQKPIRKDELLTCMHLALNQMSDTHLIDH